MTDPARDADIDRNLAGRRVLVTGGTTGIGRAVAVRLASEGARLFLCGRRDDHLADALRAVAAVGEGGGMAIDLAEPDAVSRLFAEADRTLGGLDVAVINAAVPAGGLTDMDEQTLARVIAVNFTSWLFAAHAAAARLERGGHIVMTGSLSARILGPGSTVYAGIKAGIAGVSEALRRELAPRGIAVTLIEPGLTAAEMHMDAIGMDGQRRQIAEEHMLRAEDIAATVRFALTRPGRAVVQQITVVPRANPE